MSEPYLIVRVDNGRHKVDLSDGPVTVGRHRSNVLHLEDDRVSRYHCVIEQNGGTIKVTDLGSSNGTKVNGRRVTSAELEVGDIVKVGGVKIELVVPGQAPRRQREEAERRAAAARAAKVRGRAVEAEGEAGAYELKLRRMIDALEDRSVEEGDLTIVNTRGERLHRSLRDLAEEEAEKSGKKRKKGDDPHESQEGVKLLRLLLLLCVRTGASDIHVEPRPGDCQIRIRVDGTMVEVAQLPLELGARLTGVVKVLCNLDIAQKNTMQDGHFSCEAGERHIDYRVSFTPVVHGQKLVIRVLDLSNTPRYLNELDLPDWMYEQIKQLMRQNAGMLLNCGPTGSGKTTSLYAAIREIDVGQRNVITIEDPPEYEIPGVTQTPINERQGNTFSSLLRSILRQDPDVIMLGEIRDRETAQIALQAAMTGHLVLSTVHARDSIGSIYRMLDLGAERYLVATALNLVLAQRLVRKLCPHCKTAARPKPQQQVQMGRAGQGLTQIYFPSRCEKCLQTGYNGRIGVYELLTTNEEIRDIIMNTANLQELRKAIANTLFSSLKENAYKLVARGVTDLSEVERVIGLE